MGRYRNGATMLNLKWLIPTILAAVALVTVELWLADPFPVRQARHIAMLDAEHDALCRKYGVTEPTQLSACKSDIMELRHRTYAEDMLI
jgi:hypothetical protein